MNELDMNEIISIYKECGLEQKDLGEIDSIHDFPLPNRLVSDMFWEEEEQFQLPEKEEFQMVFFG